MIDGDMNDQCGCLWLVLIGDQLSLRQDVMITDLWPQQPQSVSHFKSISKQYLLFDFINKKILRRLQIALKTFSLNSSKGFIILLEFDLH